MIKMSTSDFKELVENIANDEKLCCEGEVCKDDTYDESISCYICWAIRLKEIIRIKE